MQKESLVYFQFSRSITSSECPWTGTIYNRHQGWNKATKQETSEMNFTLLGLSLIKSTDTQERTEHSREIQV